MSTKKKLKRKVKSKKTINDLYLLILQESSCISSDIENLKRQFNTLNEQFLAILEKQSTLVTPILGTPTNGTLTNYTGLSIPNSKPKARDLLGATIDFIFGSNE